VASGELELEEVIEGRETPELNVFDTATFSTFGHTPFMWYVMDGKA
jgi:hypothetical protein